jgi:hypothetical protein
MKVLRIIIKTTIIFLSIFVGFNLIVALVDYNAKRKFVQACEKGWQTLSETGLHPFTGPENPNLFIFSDNSQIPMPSEFEDARHCYFKSKDGPGVFKDIGEILP